MKHVVRKVGTFTSQRYRLNPDEEVQMSGYLKFRLGQRGRWKESWWALKDHVLYKYKAMGNPEAEETVVVLGWKLETLSDVSFILPLIYILMIVPFFRKILSYMRVCLQDWCSNCPSLDWNRWFSVLTMTTLPRSGPMLWERRQHCQSQLPDGRQCADIVWTMSTKKWTNIGNIAWYKCYYNNMTDRQWNKCDLF